MTDENEHVGYFAWVRHNGIISPEKYDRARDGMNVEATKQYADATVLKRPITAAEWKLTLGQLAKKYPLPQGTV